MEKNPNNFSQWFPKLEEGKFAIEKAGLKLPKSWWFDVPEIVQRSWYAYDSGMKYEEFDKYISDFVDSISFVFDECSFVFNKNGTFSDKFDFDKCTSTRDTVKSHLMNINYNALCLSAGGIDEVVFREVIRSDPEITPTIYHGLPFRPEFRVFYDFDSNHVLYVHNYWDHDYCYESICRNATDKIVWDAHHDYIDKIYEEHKKDVVNKIDIAMLGVHMAGKWSIDVLLDEWDNYWLIDMAKAENSAYWNPKLVK